MDGQLRVEAPDALKEELEDHALAPVLHVETEPVPVSIGFDTVGAGGVPRSASEFLQVEHAVRAFAGGRVVGAVVHLDRIAAGRRAQRPVPGKGREVVRAALGRRHRQYRVRPLFAVRLPVSRHFLQLQSVAGGVEPESAEGGIVERSVTGCLRSDVKDVAAARDELDGEPVDIERRVDLLVRVRRCRLHGDRTGRIVVPGSVRIDGAAVRLTGVPRVRQTVGGVGVHAPRVFDRHAVNLRGGAAVLPCMQLRALFHGFVLLPSSGPPVGRTWD